jgi:hypothetical protein
MPSLKNIVDNYMWKVSGLKEHCNRCLRTERWGGKDLYVWSVDKLWRAWLNVHFVDMRKDMRRRRSGSMDLNVGKAPGLQ